MAAAAIEVSEAAKWQAYEAIVARRPKQDRRSYAAAGAQTRWIMEAITQWFNFSYLNLQAGRGPAGLPSENILYRAGLMLPRAPMRPIELVKDTPAIVIAVGKAIEELRDSRVRVLIVCERAGYRGLESAAHELGMSPESTRKTLKEARDALAHVLRGMGWKVPKDD